ncbi:MAG TPA: integrase arm-type DNA-binding domain-containing protein [Stellaceae bacterium]|nr:integrase arm-type DNA-binding domain-containing protein [Stellaceae bacterium]
MPRHAKPLTVRGIEGLKAPEKSDILKADGGGLYFRVTPTGGRSWVFRYAIGDKRRDMGLGPYPDVGLSEARDKAAELRRQKRDGIDPLAAKAGRRAAAAKAMTFKQCAEAYIEAHKAGWRNAKHGAQWTATLETYAYPTFGKLPVADIDTALVMTVLRPIWTAKPETASRVRGRIESIIGWATVSGYRQGDNPARWRGHLDALLPQKTKVRAVEHHAALPYAEIGKFMAGLRAQEGAAAKALEFAILTAARTGEVIGATWQEIDWEGRTWTIPPERMKAHREHRVPLSTAALAILKALPKGGPGDRVFPLSNMALLMTLRRMERGDLTAHGFRSTFRDWAAERTAFPSEVAEMALAHVVGDKVEAAYRRGDLFEKRRQLAEAWSRFCAQPAAGGGDNVRPLRA